MTALAFSEDGRNLASASIANTVEQRSGTYDNSVKIWDWSSANQRQALKHMEEVTELLFNDTASLLASLDSERTVRLWNLKSATKTEALQWKDRSAMSFSPDGRILAVAGTQDFSLWNIPKGTGISSKLDHEREVSALAFSPDAGTLAILFDHEAIGTWDTQTGKPLDEVLNLKVRGDFNFPAFSPEGNILVRAWQNGFWISDLKTGQLISGPLQNGNWISGMSFSPNGRNLLVGDIYKQAKIWDLETEQTMAIPMFHDHGVSAVTFSPDGRTCAIGTRSGAIFVWNVPLPALDDPERVWLSAQARTGYTIESGRVRELSLNEWESAQMKLIALGGDCLTPEWGDLPKDDQKKPRQPFRSR